MLEIVRARGRPMSGRAHRGTMVSDKPLLEPIAASSIGPDWVNARLARSLPGTAIDGVSTRVTLEPRANYRLLAAVLTLAR